MATVLRGLRRRPGDRRAGDQPGARRPTGEQTIEVVEQVFADWDAEPLLARLAEVGIPAGKVRTIDEVYDWDQTASQGLLIDVEHSVLGPLTLPGPPLRFFEADGDRGHPRRPRGAADARRARRTRSAAWLAASRTPA